MPKTSLHKPPHGIDCRAVAREVFEIEAAGVLGLADALTEDFDAAVEAILAAQGRAIVCGMGKSGIIGKKLAATLASTGTPAFFMHPGEAFHGDLGMVAPADIFVALSNSGETEELVKLLPFLKDNGNLVIGMTGNTRSTLARHADLHLSVHVEREACPLQLAPTASTTATLAMCDALAVALMRARNFQPDDFARFHPGGSLGRRLLHMVREEMRSDDLPFVAPHGSADEVLSAVSRGKLGIALVSDDQNNALGIITDGDLRRAVQGNREAFFGMTASDMMTPGPVTIGADSSMQAAFELMARHKITLLVVVDASGVVGVVQK